MKFMRIFFLGGFLCFWLGLGVMESKAEMTAEEVRAQAEKAVAIRHDNQLLADEWAREKAGLLQEIEAREKELKITSYKRQKNETYLVDLAGKVEHLELERTKVLEIYDELEPLLDEYAERLIGVIEKDLPFQKEKRLARVNFVKRNLDNCDAGLTEKTRRFLETLRLETEFGHALDVDEGELMIGGGLIRVHILHVGRLAVFVLSRDGRKAWRWDRDLDGYAPVEPYARQVSQAVDLAEKNRVIGLVKLPLGQLQTREGER